MYDLFVGWNQMNYFFFSNAGHLSNCGENLFFSKRKHPPDGNLTQFDPSFLIHPSLADHGRTAKNSQSECPALFRSCLFKKDDCTKLIFLFGNFLVKSCFVGKLPAWSSNTNTYVYTLLSLITHFSKFSWYYTYVS